MSKKIKKTDDSNFPLKYFAGIGSRSTPQFILDVMPKITEYLYGKNYILRSGGADGADSYFEKGVPLNYDKEIFLPWRNFNNNSSPYYIGSDLLDQDNYLLAESIAKKFHPRWDKLNDTVKKLMTRNVFQILGPNPNDSENHSDLVVCYCPFNQYGKLTGGTSQALRIAEHYNIKVYNLFLKEDLDKILKKVA